MNVYPCSSFPQWLLNDKSLFSEKRSGNPMEQNFELTRVLVSTGYTWCTRTFCFSRFHSPPPCLRTSKQKRKRERERGLSTFYTFQLATIFLESLLRPRAVTGLRLTKVLTSGEPYLTLQGAALPPIEMMFLGSPASSSSSGTRFRKRFVLKKRSWTSIVKGFRKK